jgi:hypothetical protein
MTTLNWYILYPDFASGPTQMRLTATKEEAIAVDLLDQHVNVKEIGPMLSPSDGSVINSDEIRQIHESRDRPTSLAD